MRETMKLLPFEHKIQMGLISDKSIWDEKKKTT